VFGFGQRMSDGSSVEEAGMKSITAAPRSSRGNIRLVGYGMRGAIRPILAA
jgi:hypothetical protein